MSADVVIIGGSLAGAACVRELTRRNIDALALERESFPREKVCGGFLSPNAVECIDKLGLTTAIKTAGATEVDHARIVVDGAQFEVPLHRRGLGISRRSLDAILADGAEIRHGITVRSVRSREDGFIIETDKGTVETRVLVDAAGKLSRFTRRLPASEFGLQYYEDSTRGSGLDFWFFPDGYGGAVTVEQSRSNFCFLINKDALGRYVAKPNCLVTGPITYEHVPGDFIAIGDAAGMIDPFCGEGMHHALDTGMTAARLIARGFEKRRTYAEIRQAYELERSRRWAKKRLLGECMRIAVKRPRLLRKGFSVNPGWFIERLWATIPA